MAELNKNNLLITVGITSYERLNTLKQTIHSVVNQSYKNLEIFICDDCSLDNQIDIFINSLALYDKRIKFFKRSSKQGVTENVNLMVKNASGKYFLWLCDDDWIDLNYIEKCLSYIEENNGYSLVTGASKFYLGNKFLYEAEKICVSENSSKKRFLSFHNQSLGTANSPNFGLIRIEHLLKTPLKNILGHDNVLVGNLAIYGKIRSLDDIYVHRRLGGMSETLSKMSRVCDYSFSEKYFSFFALYMNIILDILFFSSDYKKINFFDRVDLLIKFTYGLIVNFNKTIAKYLKCRYPFDFVENVREPVKNVELAQSKVVEL